MATLLIHETKNEHEYDRDHALRVWHLLRAEIPVNDNRGYIDQDWMTDDDRIICLFELLDGSQFGDMVFADLANFDQGANLIERGDDE